MLYGWIGGNEHGLHVRHPTIHPPRTVRDPVNGVVAGGSNILSTSPVPIQLARSPFLPLGYQKRIKSNQQTSSSSGIKHAKTTVVSI